MQQLSALVRRMELRGVPRGQCLAGTGLAEESLEDPYLRPTRQQYETVLSNIVTRSPPGIGLISGLAASVQDYGVLGHASLASTTMRDVDRLHRKYSELQDEFTFFADRISGGEWQIEFGTHLSRGPLAQFQLETLIASTKSALQVYTNAPVPIKSIHLTYDPPPHHELYQQIFPCPIYFNASSNRVCIDASFLDVPVVFPCEEVRKLCEAHCERLLATLHTSNKMSGVIRRQLTAEPGRRPTLTRISTLMGISSSKLRHELSEEGKSFHSILSGVRKEVAMDYLVSTTLSPKHIAFNLGYSNVHNFRRAFHEWTGTTPSRYRRQQSSPD